MKKLSVVLLTVILGICVWAAPVLGDDAIKVFFNESEIKFDQPPIIENGYTLVPARAILETLGLSLEFDPAAQKVTAKNDTYNIIMTIGSKTATVNDKEVTLDVAAKIVSDRTLVPMRFLVESVNLDIKWDEATRTITISQKAVTPEPVAVTPDDFSGEFFSNFPTVLNFVKFAELKAEEYTVVTNTEALALSIPTTEAVTAKLQPYYDVLTAAGFTKDLELSTETSMIFTKDDVKIVCASDAEKKAISLTIEKVVVEVTPELVTENTATETETTTTDETTADNTQETETTEAE